MNLPTLFAKYLDTRQNELAPLSIVQFQMTARVLGYHVKVDVARVTAKDAEAAKAALLTEVRPVTAQKHVRFARHVWDWAVRMKYATENPWAGVKVLVRARVQDLPEVTSEQLRRVLVHCTPDLAAMFALCRWAGLRKSEALYVDWEEIGESEIHLTPRDGEISTKQSARVIPISKELDEWLNKAEVAGVEPGPTGKLRYEANVQRKAERAIEAAGMAPWPKIFQALRVSCENDWFRAGHDVFAVCGWMGHSPTVAYKCYHRAKRTLAQKSAPVV